jgi:hypothetical protein
LKKQEKVVNTWKQAELDLLKLHIDVKLEKLVAIFAKAGYVRSYKSIRDKRNRLAESKVRVNFIQVVGDTIPTPPVQTITYSSSAPHGEIHYNIQNGEIIKPFVKVVENKFETTLVVPDSHVAPGQDLKRFKALGIYTNINRPNNIVFMGDFGNLDSLSAWDAGKEGSHGKKYKDDIKVCRQALLIFLAELDKDYKPSMYFLGGNHDEGRIEKYIESHPQLRGHMDIADDLRLDELGLTYVPYRKFLTIQGTLFTHAIMNAANSPVSGKSIMNTIASLTAKSVVVGHHHRFETMSYYRHGADDVQQVLLCGLFSEHTDDYADGGANAYNRCIVMLTHWGSGRFDVCQTSIERLKSQYL